MSTQTRRIALVSQVARPGPRQSKHRPETIIILRAILSIAGTLVVTVMLLRIAILADCPEYHTARIAFVRATRPIRRLADCACADTSSRCIQGMTIADLARVDFLLSAWLWRLESWQVGSRNAAISAGAPRNWSQSVDVHLMLN